MTTEQRDAIDKMAREIGDRQEKLTEKQVRELIIQLIISGRPLQKKCAMNRMQLDT